MIIRHHTPLKWLSGMLLGLILAYCAYAEQPAAPYEAEVPVASASPEDWQKAIAPALQQVLVRISGNPQIMQTPAVQQAAARPTTLVQSFNYVTNPAGQKGQLLQVRFSKQGVNKILQSAQQPVLASSGAATSPTPSTPTFSTSTSTAAPTAVPQQNLQQITLQISGINDLQSYTGLYGYLRNLPGVVDVNTNQTRGDQVSVAIKANTTAAGLNQQILADGRLSAQPADTNQAGVLKYRWLANMATNPQSATMSPTSSPSTSTTTTAANLPQSQPAPAPRARVAPIHEGAPITSTPPVITVPVATAPMAVAPMTTARSGTNDVAQTYAAPPVDKGFVRDKSPEPVPEEILLQ